jgi:hypothetical protein
MASVARRISTNLGEGITTSGGETECAKSTDGDGVEELMHLILRSCCQEPVRQRLHGSAL